MSRFECHAHSDYSNIRLLDAINTPTTLVGYAREIGLAGICLTDHESLGGAVAIDKMQQQLIEEGSDFKLGIGNEIYLVDDREQASKFWHFILIARDAIGFKMLKELSSTAWTNSFYARGMERVPTQKNELRAIVEKYGKGHLIASSACLGGELASTILSMSTCEKMGDGAGAEIDKKQIVDFIVYCKDLFADDFYLEVQPAQSREQMIVNKRMSGIAEAFGVKIIVTTDAHYLRKEDRYVHKAYLNSKNGEREVDAFYAYAYLQTDAEAEENLKGTGLDYSELCANTLEIYNKIERYTIKNDQKVPEVAVKEYDKDNYIHDPDHEYDTLNELFQSDNPQERYWINQCYDKLQEIFGEEWNRNYELRKSYLSRLEEEASIKKYIGEKLGTCMFAYPIFLQHYIDLFWKCGSTVGAGRGSACAGLNHYLLGITQLDPIKWELPFWRYLNKDRIELPDIDIDICPSKREQIFAEIRKERGQLGCVQVCTYGTETTKSAIATACRGYRSEDYPDGIDVDIAQYMSSLCPSERGFIWPVHDLVYGNPDLGRHKVKAFVEEANKYPGLIDIIEKIEGLINHRGIHASGVVFYDDDPYETACFMTAKNGAIVTQFSLHDAEYCGDTKYDFLVTEIQDVIVQCLQMLQEHGHLEKGLTLRELYNKYIHPDVLPLEDDLLWETLASGSVLKLFQFDSQVGGQTVKMLKPRTPKEMANCNSAMRLIAVEKGGETPTERLKRMKEDISQWYSEMQIYGLSEQEIKILEPHYLPNYAMPAQQEDMMMILMDKDVCGFSLAEANDARKICAKKQMSRIDELHDKVLDKASSVQLGKYIWETALRPQLGYSFSLIHALAYSFVGLQTVYLAAYYPSIYWNCACLRVDSGSLEDNSEETLVSIYEPEAEALQEGTTFIDLPDRSGKIKKTASTDYSKLARALGATISAGVNVGLVNINESGFTFEPDEKNNIILYGLKGVTGVGDDIIKEIVANRPYTSLQDFCERVKCSKTSMVPLIKGGAFDCFGSREEVMREYIWLQCEPKKRITLQNFNGLMERNLIPEELNFCKRVFVFNKAIKKYCKEGSTFIIKDNYYEFYEKFFDIDLLEPFENGFKIKDTVWKKLYDKAMDPARTYFKANQQELLDTLNNTLFQEMWDKYCVGNYSKWEMASLGFYFHEHELIDINKNAYKVVDYGDLDENPIVERLFKRNGREFPIFATQRIAGTVIAKDDMKSCVYLLTPESGVVTVKFTRDYYAKYNKQISQPQPDGTKKVMEKSWFGRGNLLMVNGFRRGDMFVAKSYKNTESHQLYKITEIAADGMIKMTNARWGESE